MIDVVGKEGYNKGRGRKSLLFFVFFLSFLYYRED